MKKLKLIGFLLCATLNAQQWETIDTGFEIGKYQSPLPSHIGDDIITILRIDPNQYKFEILHDSIGYTSRQWAKEYNFLAVVNAGMYNGNNKNLGYMKNYGSVYTKRLSDDNAMLGLNPKSNDVPKAKIIDLKAEGWFKWSRHYNSYVQSIRMIDEYGYNTWSESHRAWSIVVVATDTDGNILLIHSRSPYTMHEFIDMMLEAPLKINRMMYLEGGPPASMYIDHCGTEFKGIGSFETGYFDNDSNYTFWKLPNIIGVLKK